jgi:hypothetical protein
MKVNWDNERKRNASTPARVESRLEIQRVVNRVKASVLKDYRDLAGEHGRLLRLALNEAEALAYQTGFPQLFFPTLALEKVKQAASWHAKQRALRRAGELSFAE